MLGDPDGDPTYWRWSADRPDEVELLVLDDRSQPWQVDEVRAAPRSLGFGSHLARTPGAAVLLWQDETDDGPSATGIWRAEGDGDFERVYDGEEPVEPLYGSAGLRILGDRLYLPGPGGTVLVSEDDGRTWSEILTWQ